MARVKTPRAAEHDLEIPGELPENLTARAARRRRHARIGHDGDPSKTAMPFRQCLEDRDAFSAERQAERGVLDIAAGDDDALGGLERRSDLEVRKRRARMP